MRRRASRYGIGWRRDAEGRAVCKTGKRRYRDEPDALANLERIMREAMAGEYRSDKRQTGVYPCAECAGWHTTSSPYDHQIVSTWRGRAE